MKKRILALLLVLTLLVLGGCTVRDTVQVMGISVTTLQELADAALSEETEAPESGEQFVTAEDPEVTQTADTVDAHGGPEALGDQRRSLVHHEVLHGRNVEQQREHDGKNYQQQNEGR